MNEFDNNEERLEPHITEENEKEAVNNTSDSTEGNTTYHYAYKKPENKEADNNTPQGGYYQPPQSS